MNPKIFYCTVTNDLNQDQRMHRIATSLCDLGHEVHLIGRNKRSSSPLLSSNFKQHRLNCWFEKGFLFYLEYNIRLLAYLSSRKLDVTYSVDLDTIMVGNLIKFLRRKKLVFDAHEFFTETPELVNRPFIKMIWSSIASICIPNADKAISVSQSLCKVLGEQHKIHFECIYNAPKYVDEATKRVSKSVKYILYQGMLNQGRGLKEMIAAMEYVDAAYELWIVGSGDIEDELKKMAESNTSKDRIKFLGWKLPNELNRITSNAYLGLNLLEGESKSYYFSLANKFFDYMHAGIPSVNLSFPEYKAMISHFQTGILIDDLEAKTLANSLNDLLHRPGNYADMQSQCKEASKVYNWQNEEKKLYKLLDF